MNPILKNLLFWAVLVVIGVAIWNLSTDFGPREETISFSEFVNRVDAGQVAKVTINDTGIRGKTKAGEGFRTFAPRNENVVPRLLEKGVGVEIVNGGGSQSAGSWLWLYMSVPLFVAAWVFPIAILVIALVGLRRLRRIEEKLERLAPGRG